MEREQVQRILLSELEIATSQLEAAQICLGRLAEMVYAVTSPPPPQAPAVQ